MNNLIKCPTCKKEYEESIDKCDNCGYPFSGTDKEKSHFVAHQILKKSKVSNTKDSIKWARIVLFIIGGINIVFSFILNPLTGQGGVIIGVSVFIGLIFVYFGFMIRKYPFVSILIPLLLLSLFYFIGFIINPASLLQGIIWKVIFLGVLIYSLKSVIESEKIKKESRHLSNVDYK